MTSRLVVALASLVVGAGGCTTYTSVTARALAPPSPVADASRVPVAHEATGVPTTIGRDTFSVFAIPVSAVHFEGESGAIDVMNGAREAVRVAGYEPVTADVEPDRPVLTCDVGEMSFKTYTWTAPRILVWGTVRLRLALVRPDGTEAWARDYEKSYDGDGFGESIERGVEVALGTIFTRAAEDFTTPEFQAACCGASPQ
ncbi:MAG: hypothetical protein KC560_12620 [Myxococcales bacterium]|nr:hypothetical protein [Myxococcales bacterium]